MQIEQVGKVVAILPTQSGQSSRGSWMKNQFIIEWQDNGYKQNLCLDVMGEDKWDKMKQSVVVGNDVNVRFSVSSREYNGRWFTSCQCFYCANVGGQQQTVNNDPSHAVQSAQQAPAPQDDSSLPF